VPSPFYGAPAEVTLDGEQYASRFGQSQIVVLLIDGAYLDSTGREWPLRTRDYRRMLQRLTDADAAAVFVDIFFRQDNEQRRERIARLFEQAACMQAASACSSVDPDWRCGDAEPACPTPADAAGTAIVFAGTLQDPVPTALGTRPPGTALAAMLTSSDLYKLEQTAIDGETYDTAGWALYKAWCRRNETCDAAALAAFPRSPMYLHWGYAPDRALTDIAAFGGQVCRKQATTLGGRLVHSLQIFGWNLVRGFSDDRIAPCPYHTQVKMPLFDGLSDAELRELVAGKVVLIGASLKNYPDYQWSPVHDFIPGVFWHAMALDNLMEFGPRYRKDPEEFLSDNFEVFGIVLILGLHGIVTWLIQRRRSLQPQPGDTGADRERREAESIKLDLVHGLLTICVIAGTVLLFTGVRNWSPANWIGFAMLMLLIDFKPITSLGRFCWRIYPTARLSNRSFSYWMFKALSWVTVAIAIVPAFLLFVMPHALLLGRYVDDTIGSYVFLALYGLIILGCLFVILRETSS
jgi:hypothetical protein